MKSDDIDLDFLNADDEHPSGPARPRLRLDALSEQAAVSDMVDLSLLMVRRSSRKNNTKPQPPIDLRQAPQPDQKTTDPDPGFDINEDALRLPLDLAPETAKADRQAHESRENLSLSLEALNDDSFSLEAPPSRPSLPDETTPEMQIEFESVPELDDPLILPPEPETPGVAPALEVPNETTPEALKEELNFDFRVDPLPPSHPIEETSGELHEEPLHIFAKPAESLQSKVEPRGTRKFERPLETPGPQARPSSPAKASPQTKRISPPSLLTASFSLSALFENTRLLGLDIGASSIKYIILKKTMSGLKLIDCGTRPLPELPIEAADEDKHRLIGESLRKHFKIKAFKNALITSAISGLEVFYQSIQVPKMARKDLAKAVPWTCRKDFPFPMESTVFEYQLLNSKEKKANGKYDIFVIAAQESVIASHMEILKHARVSPAKISTLPVALWHTFRAAVKSDNTKSYALIDIGGKSSHFIFVKGGQLRFAREISTGGDDFTDALTGSIFVEGKEIAILREQAERLKRSYGVVKVDGDTRTAEGVPVKEIMVMMGPVLEKLSNEIRRTVDFVKEKFGISNLHKIYLTGGGSFLKNLPTKLQQELNTEVLILNPFRSVSTRRLAKQNELFQLGPRFATAMGLALDRKRDLNLLPRKLKGAHTFQYVKKMFHYVFIILVLLMVWFSQDIKRELQHIKNEFARMNDQFNEVKPKREKFLELQKTLSELKKRTDLYKSQIDIQMGADNHLRAISNLVTPNITLTSLRMLYRNAQNEQKEDFIQEIVVLEGVAFQNNSMEGINLAKFLMDLERSNYFYAVSLKYQKIRDDGNLEFTLECEL